MNAIQKLSEKIKQATDLIAQLKRDKKSLESEITLLRISLADLTSLKQENQQLHIKMEKLRARFERMNGRIEKLLSEEEMVLSGAQGGQHE